MSYYLIRRDEGTERVQIVASCKQHAQKSIILNNYCKNNNINLVVNRQAINDKCVGNEIYCYKITDNQYILLDCIDHPGGYIMSPYVEKHRLGILEFLFFTETDLPLGELSNTLKMKVKRDGVNSIN